VGRTSVTFIAHSLQNKEIIKSSRGHIRVLNRAGLEERSCECYFTMRDQTNRLFKLGSVSARLSLLIYFREIPLISLE